MDRLKATQLTRAELDSHDLSDWGVRLTTDPNQGFLGLCMGRDKIIMLNAHHIDIHPDAEIIDTIKHEVAHALTQGHGHDDIWKAKAKEIGCTNTLPCSHLTLPDHVIDAIRSGQTIEMTVEEETHVIRTPKYKVTRLQDKCPDCGKVAKERFAIEIIDKDGNTVKLITLECFHIIKKVIPRGTPFESMISNSHEDRVKKCKHEWLSREEAKLTHRPSNRCTKCGEFKLYPFQVIGAKNAESGLSMQKGFGVFDDMGLGKTVQALAVVKFHSEYTPTLYVVKSAIKFQWFKEIIRWLGPDYLAQVISTSKDYVFPNLKSYIIAYDLLRRFPREKLDKLGIKLVILDECQQIKNPDSTRTQEVRRLVGNNETKVLPLSGTPWKNRGGEFFPVLNMMDPIKFYSYQHYLDNWVSFYWEGAKKKQGGIRDPKKFREYISSLVVRREYNEVMDEFPDINKMKLNVQLEALEQQMYDESTSDFVKWYNEKVIGGEEDKISGIEILAQLSRMRHITGLAKIPATLGFVEEFIENQPDQKLVIFVHHKDVGQLMVNALTDLTGTYKELAETLKDEGYTILKLTAEFSDEERFVIQETFNKTSKVIMIASTLASGEGLNLQTCHNAVMHERQWNPQNEDQAAPGRFRRIGQESGVINITFTEAEGTIDEHLDGIVEDKRRAFHEVMNKGEIIGWDENDIGLKLAQIIVSKHQQRMKAKGIQSKPISQMATLVRQ